MHTPRSLKSISKTPFWRTRISVRFLVDHAEVVDEDGNPVDLTLPEADEHDGHDEHDEHDEHDKIDNAVSEATPEETHEEP